MVKQIKDMTMQEKNVEEMFISEATKCGWQYVPADEK